MTSRLGVYWSVMHRRPQDYSYFSALQPAIFKLMDAGPPDYQWANANLPDSIIIARDWAMSEQHDDVLGDPEGTGRRHAQEWNSHADYLGIDRGRTLVLGLNEPRVWETGVPDALRRYTIALCDEARDLGLYVGAMQLGVGWPGNHGADTPPDWSPFAGVEAAILRGHHMLVCHEYWADQGPGENWGWWGGRSLKCPWNVPLVIGECGVDMYVKDSDVGGDKRGWMAHMPPERYASELWDYTNRMSVDSRFMGCCTFTCDFAADDWYSFDVEPAYQAILASPRPPEPEPEPEPPIPPLPPMHSRLIWPVIGPITQAFGVGGEQWGMPGHDGIDIACPEGTAVCAIDAGEVMYTGWDEGGYGNYVRIWHESICSHSFYAHLSEILCYVGDLVTQSMIVGIAGNTGNSTGPHLHFELRAGTRESYIDITYGYPKGRYNPADAYAVTGSPVKP